MQNRVKSALFLDFDNIYGGLHALDSEQADAMADEPWQWLEDILEHASCEGKRDVLVKRAYLNPAGRVQNRDGTFQYFSKIRPRLTRSGFEIIDCPSLTRSSKNAADIRIVMDVLAYLNRSCRYEEFVIASSDADFTPLLHHLRADDRRAIIVASGQTSTAYREVADAVLDIGVLLEAGKLTPSEIEVQQDRATLQKTELRSRIADSGEEDSRIRAAKEASAFIHASDEPVLLATFATQLRTSLGPSEGLDDWFGYQKLGRFLESINDSFIVDGHHVWDTVRHGVPVDQDAALPDTVRRICNETGLPRLDRSKWRALFAVMAQYADENEFNLTHCTAWCRDQLRNQSIGIGRVQIGYIVRSTLYGGQPLTSDPAPTAAQIKMAVLNNTVAQANAVHLDLTETEEAELSDWLGGNQ